MRPSYHRMPTYQFSSPLEVEPEDVVLQNDDEAWSQAVDFCGKLLRDIDGDLPGATDWKLQVREGTRQVATIHIVARRHETLTGRYMDKD